VVTIDIDYYTRNPIALHDYLEILLGNEMKWLPTTRYGRTSFETYRDDFVISGYFHKVSGTKGSKSVSKAN
jgi:hypothetical protein